MDTILFRFDFYEEIPDDIDGITTSYAFLVYDIDYNDPKATYTHWEQYYENMDQEPIEMRYGVHDFNVSGDIDNCIGFTTYEIQGDNRQKCLAEWQDDFRQKFPAAKVSEIVDVTEYLSDSSKDDSDVLVYLKKKFKLKINLR